MELLPALPLGLAVRTLACDAVRLSDALLS